MEQTQPCHNVIWTLVSCFLSKLVEMLYSQSCQTRPAAIDVPIIWFHIGSADCEIMAAAMPANRGGTVMDQVRIAFDISDRLSGWYARSVKLL